jgi:hypothetical protein
METALARLVMAVLAVLGAGALIEAVFPRVRVASIDRDTVEMEMPADVGDAAKRFVGSLGHIAVRTVPALAIGVVGSMILVQYLPQDLMSSDTFRVLAIIVVATVAVPLALPTFFEIPLALGLIAAGAPAGAALALLFAGPAVNLPSLLTLARMTNWKVSSALALVIWVTAVAGGLIVG